MTDILLELKVLHLTLLIIFKAILAGCFEPNEGRGSGFRTVRDEKVVTYVS